MHKWDFRNTYYLIILCVRGWELWDMLDLKTPVGVRRGEVRCIFGAFFLDKEKTYKIENQYLVGLFLRRERDSCFGKRLRRLRTPTRVFSSPLM